MGILKKGDTEIKLAIRGDEKDMLQAKVDATNSCSYLFYEYEAFEMIDISRLDTSNVTDMSWMFTGCGRLSTLDLSILDTSKVTNLSGMFRGCSNLVELNLSHFNTSNVTSMSSMFWECYALSNVDIHNFDTSNVTSIGGMFKGCHNLLSLDVSNFDTSKVTSMDSMFMGCQKLTSLDIRNFDTSKVTNMSNAFRDLYLVKNILGTIDMIKVSSTYYASDMFRNCYVLEEVTLKNITQTLQIGSGTTYGTLLNDPTVINTAKELWDLTSATSRVLTVSTPTDAKFDTIYVKLIEATDEMIANDPNIIYKKPCEVCDSTDEGAMTLRAYIISKNWTISK